MLTADNKKNSRLCFDEKGEFRLLILTDLQEGPDYDKRSLEGVISLVEKTKPHLVLLGGDNLVDCHSAELFKATLDVFASVMEERGICWTQVFGNHDVECNHPLTKGDMEQIYQSYPHNISRSDKGGAGACTHMLPIYNKEGKIAFAVYAMDSGDYIELPQELMEDIKLEGFVNPTHYATMDPENLIWYYNTSKALEEGQGHKVPGIMFFHICLHEFDVIAKNPEKTGMTGSKNEATCPGVLNSGLFSAVVKRGDVKGIYCGHDHTNTYEGRYFGVRLGFCSNIGYSTYGLPGDDTQKNALRGGRLITVCEEDAENFTSEMIYVK